MRVEPGHRKDDLVVHLTKTLLGSRALCGVRDIYWIGVPPGGTPCDECVAIAEDAGASLDESIYLQATGLAPRTTCPLSNGTP